jgi:hypothetical protein
MSATTTNSALLKGMLGIAASSSEEIQQLPAHTDVSVLCERPVVKGASSAKKMKGAVGSSIGDGSSKNVKTTHIRGSNMHPPPAGGEIINTEKVGKGKNNDAKKKKGHHPSNKIKDATPIVSEKSKKTTENNYAWSAFQSSPDPSTLPDIGGLFSSLKVGERERDVREESSIVEEEKFAAVLFGMKEDEKNELSFQQKEEYEDIIPIAAPKIKDMHDQTLLHQVRQQQQKHQFSDPIMELMNPGGDPRGYGMVPSIQYHPRSPHYSGTFLPQSEQFHHLPPCKPEPKFQ